MWLYKNPASQSMHYLVHGLGLTSKIQEFQMFNKIKKPIKSINFTQSIKQLKLSRVKNNLK